MKNKTITLNLVGYVVNGGVQVKFWDGNLGYIVMDTISFKHRPSIKEIAKEANDGGFGVETIIGMSHIVVTEVYEDELGLKFYTNPEYYGDLYRLNKNKEIISL